AQGSRRRKRSKPGREAGRFERRGDGMMPGAAARRGPLPVLAALAGLWIAHRVTGDLGFRPGPYQSGILTLVTMLAAALYVVRRRFLLLSLYTVRLLTSLPFLSSFTGAIVRLAQLRSWRLLQLAIV